VFGLVGNIVAIIVLSRPAMKGSFSSLLIGKIRMAVFKRIFFAYIQKKSRLLWSIILCKKQ
jgi:hypothetical protein